jgi:hypothetical protein
MGSVDNRTRAKWQDYSGENAGAAEKFFFITLSKYFAGTEYVIREKPNEFRDLYVNVNLPDETIKAIYNPPEPITKHGISPDYAIDNTRTGKTLYVEVKRQDGWVEGKDRKAGRGNAHERSCKYFTPGLLKTLRAYGKINGENTLPFWTVFQGDITRDPCRVREITLWYEGYPAHYFLWRDSADAEALINHFNENLKNLLD